MFNSVSGVKIPTSLVNKFKNQETENLSKNVKTEEKKQKLSYPASSLQKAYFVPSFTGTVTDITGLIQKRKESEAENPPKKGKSLDTKCVQVNLETETARINGIVDLAVQIAKEAKVVTTDYGAYHSLNGLSVRTNYNINEDYKQWTTAKEGSHLFLYVKTDEKLDPQDEKSYVKVPLSQKNGQRLLDEVNKKFSPADLESSLGATSPDLFDLLLELQDLTVNNKIKWEEFRDHDNALSLRTKYNNYNIDLLKTPKDATGDLDYDDENEYEGAPPPLDTYSIAISKVSRSKKDPSPILIFNSVDQEQAISLDRVIGMGYKKYRSDVQKKGEEQQLVEAGFLKVKTKNDREKLVKLLESLGFERTQKGKDSYKDKEK